MTGLSHFDTGMTCNNTIEKLGGTGPDVLLIHGYGADRMTWLATAPALIRYASVWVIDLPGVTYQLERCGHLPQMEQSVIVNRLLTRFHQDLTQQP